MSEDDGETKPTSAGVAVTDFEMSSVQDATLLHVLMDINASLKRLEAHLIPDPR